jgi:hypothetical protein
MSNNSKDDNANWIDRSLTGGGWLPSNGQRTIKTSRESQVILSQTAQDNIGRFADGPGFNSRGSINAGWPGGKSDGKLNVADMNDQDHSIDKTRTGTGRGAFGEEALKKPKSPQAIGMSIVAHAAHLHFSGNADSDSDD